MLRPTIFISFKSEEKDKAKVLKDSLEKLGFSIWWSEKIQCGQEWHGEIDKAIEEAAVIIVLWSKKSITSLWVRHEASQAIVRHVYAPVRAELVEIDSPFNRIQATDLQNWSGQINDPGFQNLLVRIRHLIPEPIPIWKRILGSFWKQRGLIIASIITVIALFLLFNQKNVLDNQVQRQIEISNSVDSNLKAQNQLINSTKRLLKPLPSNLNLALIFEFNLCEEVRNFLKHHPTDNVYQDNLLRDILVRIDKCNNDKIFGTTLSLDFSIYPATVSYETWFAKKPYIEYNGDYSYTKYGFGEYSESKDKFYLQFEKLPLEVSQKNYSGLYSIDDLDNTFFNLRIARPFLLKNLLPAFGKITYIGLFDDQENELYNMNIDSINLNNNLGKIKIENWIDPINFWKPSDQK